MKMIRIDEIYTIEYIEREASLIIRMFSPYKSKRKKFNVSQMPFSDLDRRIMKKWEVFKNGT